MIENTLSGFEPYALRELFYIAFELFPDKISDKIGVYFFPFTTLKDLRDLMKIFVEKGFCLPEKAEAVINWRRGKIPEGRCLQDINHFKFQFEKNNLVSVKTYLRHSDTFMYF